MQICIFPDHFSLHIYEIILFIYFNIATCICLLLLIDFDTNADMAIFHGVVNIIFHVKDGNTCQITALKKKLWVQVRTVLGGSKEWHNRWF